MSQATPQILIVEDEPIIAADLRDRLEEHGFGILGAVDSGEKALEMVRRRLPDLVLMDVNLAGKLDGVATALAIRELADVPLIFLTSNSDAATFSRARAARPRAFLSKPFRGRDLTNAISLAIGEVPGPAVPPNPAPAAAPLNVPEELPEGQAAAVFQDRLFIKVRERLTRLMLADILWVEADDFYCKVVTEEREYLVTKTLKKLAGILPPTDFIRCHRSYLVNIRRVTEIGEIYIFIGEHKVPISRSKRGVVMERIVNA